MSHTIKRGSSWYVYLFVPKDVRKVLGRSKFQQTLKTSDEREAERRARPIIAH